MLSALGKGKVMGPSPNLDLRLDPSGRSSSCWYVQRLFGLLKACLRHLPDDFLDENHKSVIWDRVVMIAKRVEESYDYRFAVALTGASSG